MDRITSFAALPPTLSSISSGDTANAMATAALTKTVTKTVTRTLSVAARTTDFAVASKYNLAPRAPIPDVPSALLTRATRLYTKTVNYREFRDLARMSPAFKVLLGAAIVAGGFVAIRNWLPEMANHPPLGEDQCTWKDRLHHTYMFLKNAAKENEKLRKDIATAHEERDQARQDKATFESTHTGTDPESNKLKKEWRVVKGQMASQKQEIATLKAEITTLKDTLAQRDNHTQELLQARQNEEGLRNKFHATLGQRYQAQLDLALLQAHNGRLLSQTQELQQDLKSARDNNEDLHVQIQIRDQELSQLQGTAQASAKEAKELQEALAQKEVELKDANESARLSDQLAVEYNQHLEEEKQRCTRFKNDVNNEKKRGDTIQAELTREKKRLAAARFSRTPRPLIGPDGTPSRLALSWSSSGHTQSTPTTAIRKPGLDASPPRIPSSATRHPAPETPSLQTKTEAAAAPAASPTSTTPAGTSPGNLGLNASPPVIPSSTTRDSVPETRSLQIKAEAVAAPASSPPSTTPDGTPSRKRSRGIKDDGNVPSKKIKSEPNSDAEPMGTDDQGPDKTILDTIEQTPDRMILDTDEQLPTSPNSVFRNLPTLMPTLPRPDQASSSPESGSSSSSVHDSPSQEIHSPGPDVQYSLPPRPSAPTPNAARRAPSVLPEPSPIRARSTRNASRLPTLNERELSQRAATPAMPSQLPARRSPTRLQPQVSPSRTTRRPPQPSPGKTARQTRSQSPR